MLYSTTMKQTPLIIDFTHTPQFALRLKKSAQNYNLLNG